MNSTFEVLSQWMKLLRNFWSRDGFGRDSLKAIGMTLQKIEEKKINTLDL